MTRNLLKYVFVGLTFASVFSCKKNNVAVDVDPLIAPEAARFLKTTTSESIFILDLPSGGSSVKLPIGVTNVSNVDRQVQFTYTSSTGAVANTQYKAPAAITIPAGKVIDTLTFQGLFAGYPTGRRDTVKVTIASTGGIKANAYNNTYTFILQKYCPVVLASLAGDYDNTVEYKSGSTTPNYGPYTTTMSNFAMVVGSTTKATATLENLYDYGWGPINIGLDWTDAANFKVTMVNQLTGTDYDIGQPYSVRASAGQKNTFSSCDQSFTITVDVIVNNYPTAGLAAFEQQNYRVEIKR